MTRFVIPDGVNRTWALASWFYVLTAVVACSGSSASPSGGGGGAAQGTVNGACYANETCKGGLSCVADTCVDPGKNGGVTADASSDDSSTASDASDAAPDATLFNDAGLPCPGATINHPGPEPRGVATTIPFVGLARDSTCAAITGPKLVWTDDREGQFGTGEMLSHKFTLTGPHTVTLTATDAQGKTSTATVTFTLS